MEIVRHWRLNEQHLRLIGEVCPACHFHIFPPRDICPSCGGLTIETFAEETTPKTMALVKLEEGPILAAELTDWGRSEPKVGMEVELVQNPREANSQEMPTPRYQVRPTFGGGPSISKERR